MQDQAMEQIHSPFGLDVDSAQTLLLATSELFRLVNTLGHHSRGLEDALTKRNNAESRRKRYDRMKVCSTLATNHFSPALGLHTYATVHALS